MMRSEEARNLLSREIRKTKHIHMAIDEIIGNFELLDEWEDKYRYLIELGRTLEPLPKDAYTDANKVRGCASQVWLETTVLPDSKGRPVMTFRGDSDAHIVRGLVALTLALYSGRTAQEVIETDAAPIFAELGLAKHLTPQRSNGLRAMVDRIKTEAHACLTH
jgi:cysteine desulfuration protein SufE